MTSSELVQNFLSHLDEVTERGDGYRALCPCHDDHQPSLDIDLSEKGDLLVICRACGVNGAAVVDKVGLPQSALFATSDGSNPAGKPEVSTHPTPRPRGPETARYSYHNADGTRVIDTIRYGDGKEKTFAMRLPDRISGGIEGRQPPLYRLPEVLAGIALGRWIVKTEGEKDADRLASELCSTTNPMGGTSGKWKRRHSEALKGAKVAILVDNDETGIAHGEEVARHLHGIAQIVKVILLDGVPNNGGDVSDWLDQRHTIDELKAIIESAPEWEPPAKPEPDEAVLRAVQRASESRIDWDGFIDKERSGEDWLVEPIIARNRQTVIYSKAKQGKSLLALELAAALATGKAVVGRPAGEPERVLYVDKEMTVDDLQERLIDLGYTTEDEPLLKENLAYYLLPTLPPMDTKHGGEVLLQLALDHKAVLVVIDTMSRVVQGDENLNDTWQDFYSHTGMLLKQDEITLIRLDHSGKDPRKGQRGGSAKYDDPDVVFELKHDEPRVTLSTKGVSRVSWVPSRVSLVRETKPLRHTWKQDPYGDRERALADLLDRLGLPVDSSKREAKKNVDARVAEGLLTPADIEIAKASSTIWTNAVRLRKSRSSAETAPRTTSTETPRTTTGTTAEETVPGKAGTTVGTIENHSPSGMGTGSQLLGGNRIPAGPGATTPQPTARDGNPTVTDVDDQGAPKKELTWGEYLAEIDQVTSNHPN